MHFFFVVVAPQIWGDEVHVQFNYKQSETTNNKHPKVSQ